MLLVLSLSGFAAGAGLVADTTPLVVEPDQPDQVVADTTLTFEDADGDGIDDDCDDVALADAAAVTAALLAVDLDADGTISTSEAAQSGWIGGANCNHGGYVSFVAQSTDELEEETEPAEDTRVPAVCEVVVVPVIVTEPVVVEPVVVEPNAHGKAVSLVAQDPAAVGGKNCNHGGAVSEAAKKDHAAKDKAAKKVHADHSAKRNAKAAKAAH